MKSPRKRENCSPGARAGRGRRPVGLAAVAGLIVLAAGCASQTAAVAPLSGEGTLTTSGGIVTGSAGRHHESASRNHEKVAPAATSVAAAPGVKLTPAEHSFSIANSGVTGGALFGGNKELLPIAPRLGRHLAIVRSFYAFGRSFPSATDRRLMVQHTTLLASLELTGSGPTYATIASGARDAYLRGFLKAMEQAAVRYGLHAIYFSFEHEPNIRAHARYGTPAAYRKAWAHVHALAQSARLDWNQGGRLHWVLILTHRAYIPLSQRPRWALRMGWAGEYYAGRSAVDAVGADGYNSPGCKPRTYSGGTNATPSSVFGPIVTWARLHGNLPVFLSEWAGSATFPSRQVTFIRQMQPFVAAHKTIIGELYWNGTGQYCSYKVNSNPLSIAALTALGHSSALQGHV